ncbi:tetratricopeptide repeat protein [Aeromonas hydrophila]|uniref:tetratricopeptide repeat protein n=1 Tax=Aeromonas TaxID=642 RepID=UPI003987E2C5
MAENTSKITEWSVDGLLDEIRHLNANMKDRSLAFVLGAGASISSGIPAGGALAKRWLEDIHLRESLKTGEKIETWASQKLGAKEFQLHDAATYYAKIFELRFGCDPQSGYAALEAVMEKAEPSIGYAILAKILATTHNKVVVTTNFDNLVADALSLQALRAPLIVGHEALTGFINPRLSRPLIAKIHRDLHLHPKNDQNGVNILENGWKDALSKLFQHYTPLVIGYGGNDESLMGFLSDLPPHYIPGRLFWCYREGDYPQERILEVVSHHRGILVAIAGFDEFMVQLAQTLFPRFMLDDISNEISEIGNQRTKKYQALVNKLMENTVKQKTESVSEITQQARQSISEVRSKEDEDQWWEWEIRANKESEPAKIQDVYKKGIKRLPHSSELHGNYANFLADVLWDYKTAEVMYKRAIELDPNNANNISNYAHFLANQLGDYDEAESMYKRALEIEPNDAYKVCNYAIFLANQSEAYDAAELMYERALELEPNNTNYICSYAIFLANKRRNYDAAEAMYERILKLEPNDANYIGSYANFLADKRRNYDAAEAMYKLAIELAPEDGSNIGNYAHFLETQREDFDAADAMYKRALEISPNNANNIVNYADFLEKQRKDNDAAEALYKQALKVSPKNADCADSYATFLVNQRGNYDAAETMYKLAIELAPKDPNHSANYAALLLSRGTAEDIEHVKNVISMVIEISREHPSQALAEVLLYHCLLTEITSKSISKNISRLKMLFDIDYERATWDFSNILSSCLPKIVKERHDFYRALAAAILDKDKVAVLDNFSWWSDATKEDPFILTE